MHLPAVIAPQMEPLEQRRSSKPKRKMKKKKMMMMVKEEERGRCKNLGNLVHSDPMEVRIAARGSG